MEEKTNQYHYHPGATDWATLILFPIYIYVINDKLLAHEQIDFFTWDYFTLFMASFPFITSLINTFFLLPKSTLVINNNSVQFTHYFYWYKRLNWELSKKDVLYTYWSQGFFNCKLTFQTEKHNISEISLKNWRLDNESRTRNVTNSAIFNDLSQKFNLDKKTTWSLIKQEFSSRTITNTHTTPALDMNGLANKLLLLFFAMALFDILMPSITVHYTVLNSFEYIAVTLFTALSLVILVRYIIHKEGNIFTPNYVLLHLLFIGLVISIWFFFFMLFRLNVIYLGSEYTLQYQLVSQTTQAQIWKDSDNKGYDIYFRIPYQEEALYHDIGTQKVLTIKENLGVHLIDNSELSRKKNNTKT